MIKQISAMVYEWQGGTSVLDFDFCNYKSPARVEARLTARVNIPKEINPNPKIKVEKSIERFHRDAIKPIINILHPILEKYGRFDLCGSYRRGKETIKDMDYVIQCSKDDFQKLRAELTGIGINFHRGANEIMNGIHQDTGIGIDFFRADPESYITLLIWRTGSKNHNIYCASIAIRQGIQILRVGIRMKDKKIIHPKTEQEFYDILGIKFIPPNQRDMEL